MLTLPLTLQLILAILVFLLAMALLVRGKQRAEPSRPVHGGARTQFIGIRQRLAFGKQSQMRKDGKSPDNAPLPFEKVIGDWLEVVPPRHVEVVKIGLRPLLSALTTERSRRSSAGIDNAMIDIVKYCLNKADQDLDPSRQRAALQKPLQAMAQLANVRIVEPKQGQIWPPEGSGSKAPRMR